MKNKKRVYNQFITSGYFVGVILIIFSIICFYTAYDIRLMNVHDALGQSFYFSFGLLSILFGGLLLSSKKYKK